VRPASAPSGEPSLRAILASLIDRRDRTSAEAEAAVGYIMDGRAGEAEMASFLTALRAKGETTEELVGISRAMRARLKRVDLGGVKAMDIVGTGGARVKGVNCSTLTALAVAGCGVPVAKHGNRAASSSFGSADLLEALGLDLEAQAEKVARAVKEAKVGFLFSQAYHPAMKHLAGVRKALGFRTTFNLLGPLNNPALVKVQLSGVFDAGCLERCAQALATLGSERFTLVHGLVGIDEFSIAGRTRAIRFEDGRFAEESLDPADAGIEERSVEVMERGDRETALAQAIDVLQGRAGWQRDMVLLNAALALRTYGRAGSLKDGVALAVEALDSGAAVEAALRMVRIAGGRPEVLEEVAAGSARARSG
jgi:anthranilate phosphoribosyltransferase